MHSPHRSLAWLGLVPVIALAYHVLAARPAKVSHPTGGERRSASAVAPPSRGSSAPGAPASAESTRRYAVELSSALRNAPDGPPAFQLELTGSLVVSASAPTLPGADVALQLHDVVLRMGQQSVERAPATEGAMLQPFEMTFAPDGSVAELRLPAGLDPVAHSLLRGIAASLQFVRPSGTPAAAARWQTDERDQLGRHAADYVVVDAQRVEKHKRDYRMPDSDAPLSFAGRSLRASSSAVYTFDDAAVLRELHADDQSETAAAERPLLSTGRLVLRRLEGPVPTVARAGRLLPTPLYAVADDSAQRQGEREAESVRGVELPQVFEELRGSHDSPDRQAPWRAQERMIALFNTRPGSALQAARVLPTLSKEDADMVLGALADARSKEAQEALVKLAQDPSDAALRLRALHHLALDDATTRPTLDALEAMSRDATLAPELKGAASLALGSAAGQALHQTDQPELSARALDVVDGLAQTAQTGSTREQRGTALGALGNAGHERALPAITNALGDADPRVRTDAVLALRNMQATGVDEQLAGRMTTDGSEDVRAAAIFACQDRSLSPPLIGALEATVTRDTSSAIRLQAVGLAGSHIDAVPALHAAVSRAAQSDEAADVRALAQRKLDHADENPEGIQRYEENPYADGSEPGSDSDQGI